MSIANLIFIYIPATCAVVGLGLILFAMLLSLVNALRKD